MSAATKLTEEFETKVINIRGTEYRFRELTASEYNSIIKLASGPDDNAELNTVLQLMAIRSLVEPKMTATDLDAKPYPVYAKLLQTVNTMHFTPLVEAANGSEEPPNV